VIRLKLISLPPSLRSPPDVPRSQPIAKVLVQQAKMNVLMLSYRGYGLSTGTPTEKGLKIDAQVALDFITNHEVLKGTPIM
jgi:hypothetical protein